MYVHLGGGCLIRVTEIIGIFSVNSVNDNKEFYKTLKNKDGRYYEAEDLSEGGVVDSIVLSQKKIYLSAVSVSTLQKRINQDLIYNNGGNNG